MKQIRAGSLENAVLAVARDLKGEGYGVTIQKRVSEILGRDVSFGALYTTLHRLKDAGLLESRFGEPTRERGGRAKKFYRITGAGENALRNAQNKLRAFFPAEGTLQLT